MSYLDKLKSRFDNVELGEHHLDEYQLTAIEFLKTHPRSALFIDTGLGKTAICLKLIRDLIDDDKINKVLIIAPLKVANQTWGDEISKWHFSAPLSHKLVRAEHIIEAVNAYARNEKTRPFNESDLKKISRKVNTRVNKFLKNNPDVSESDKNTLIAKTQLAVEKEYRKWLTEKARVEAAGIQIRKYERECPTVIHIINHEMVEWLVNAWGANDWIYDCVIYDESDGIKDATTKRWKALDSIRHKTTHFYELTATPAAENHLGLFAQIKLLDGGKRLGRTMTEYKERYFNVNPYNYKITLKEGAADAIADAIADITLVMKQEDYLKDIPPYVVEDVLYELPEKQRELYNAMSKTGMIEVDGREIIAEQAGSVLQKMMQICAGFVYEGTESISDFGAVVKDRQIHYLHTAKIEALRELMKRHPDENFLISYYHQGSLALLQKHFPEAIKMDRQGTQKAAWNRREIKMLLMHPKSGAHGLNLQKGGHIVINFDVYFSYGQYYQFLRRLARRGQENDKVLVYNLLAERTYDVVVKKACWEGKQNTQNVFFELIQKCKKALKHG